MTEKEKKLYEDRLAKLNNVISAGVDPFPAKSFRTHEIAKGIVSFEDLLASKEKLVLAGRIRSIREHGGIVFGNLEDGSGSIQFMIREEDVGQDKFTSFSKFFDIGDFLEASGTMYLTKRGEKTLLVSDYRILAKSLRALPDFWHGLSDIEQKLRKRYLDILFNKDVKEIFVKKATFWQAMRSYLESKGFLEVQMPILESTTGGAEARPFITRHNALDRDFYLRISLELPLKKMLVAGYEKVFEIGRIFRNEGISPEHLQDYTQMEFYWAYASFEDMMAFCQNMYQHVISETCGRTNITSRGMTVDWSGDWKKVDYFEMFKENTGIDLEVARDGELKAYADKSGIAYEDFAERGRLIDVIFKSIRKKLGTDKPVFLINQPVELEPLAKRVPGSKFAVQRMQIIAYGTELGKGFGELNDPMDQRKRFDEQMKLREKGDHEAQMIDEDYLEAMEYGMPPSAGFGLSERLFSVLMDKSIRETVIFPLMKADSASKVDGKKDL